jgi:Peptidase family M28
VIETYLEELSKFRHRLSGSPQNLQAAGEIRDVFQRLGLQTGREYFKVPGLLAFSIALNVFAPLVVFFILKKFYGLSLVVFGVCLISLWGELTFSFHLFRRVIPAHVSCNIDSVVHAGGDWNKTVVVVAHHDTPKTGWIYGMRVGDRLAPYFRNLPQPFDRIFFPPFLGALGLGVALVIRPLHGAHPIYLVLSALSILVLSATLVITIQWGVSRASPGANDNGSGVLVLLELAERFIKKPPMNVTVKLLATGAEEAGFFGIKDYLKRHQELTKPGTFFINLDCVGGGELHWAISETTLQRLPYPRPGLEALSHVERRSGMAVLPRTPIIAPTDAGPLVKRGHMVLTLIGLENKSIPSNFHKISDTFDRFDLATLKRAVDIVEHFVRNIE